MRAHIALLFFVAATANAAIHLSAELPVAAPHPSASRANPRPYAVATDGSNFLVVWIDDGGLKTTVVSDAGTIPAVPAPAQIHFAASPSFYEISAVWTGSVYLLTWSGAVDNVSTMFAATVSREGTLLRQPYVVAAKAAARAGALARASRRAIQVYFRTDLMQLRGVIFDDAGAAIATDVILPGVAIDLRTPEVAVAGDGEEFAIVWRTPEFVGIGAMSNPPPLQQRFDTFHLQRIHDDGSAVASPITLGRVELTQAFGVASGGGKYAVVTTEQQLITPGQTRPMIDRFIVDARDGTASALPKIPSGDGDAVIWTGAAFVAYGIDAPPSPPAITTFTFSGGPESAPPEIRTLPTSSAAAFVYLASSGKNVFATWTQSTGSTMAVYGAELDIHATAYAVAPFLVSISWSRQFTPAIATSGNESLVVWIDETGGYPAGGLMALRIASNGLAMDTSPFFIATATIDERPVVTFTGATFLVVWNERSAGGIGTIVTRTVGLDGSLGARVPLGKGWGPTAASNSALTLIAFSAAQSSDIVGYRFDPRGQRLDELPIVIGNGWNPRAATNGTDFFAAWNVGSDYWQWPSANYIDVFGARMTAAGAVDAAPLPIATGAPNQVLAAVNSDGRDYLVFYVLFEQSGGLAAKRVLREGQLDGLTATEPGTIVFNDTDAIGPARYALAIATDQTGFWVGWPTNQIGKSRIILIHTDRNGTPGDPISVVDYPWWESTTTVALAQAGRGPLQIVYARPVSDGSFAGTTQVFLRFAGEPVNRRHATRH